ncbi:hypothetical protein [Desulfofundulus sp. TPOSR]|uniref:hypothetical protein n=1 Tax=Desulfofundulus sp. TPOSR TaxID=2714340 RepID=UPI001A9B9DDB|nr:hypothetical protein [Desulfofundulus sp. TPOSR]
MTEKEKKQPFTKGDAFIPEATGSATMVNLDGQWEHNFVDDPTPPVLLPKESLQKGRVVIRQAKKDPRTGV